MNEKLFAKGIYFNPRNSKQPYFLLGSLSIDINQFFEWFKQNQAQILEAQKIMNNGKKYLKLDIKNGAKCPYIEVNTYQKEAIEQESQNW